MILKVKRLHKDAVLPKYSKPGDAGMDLVGISVTKTDKYIEYDTGLALEIPEGYVGLLFPRSSVSNKDLILKNSVGIVDSAYRGSVRLRFNVTQNDKSSLVSNMFPDYGYRDVYEVGERVGQLIVIPIPLVEIQEVDELSVTERGEGGFGHTGN